MGKILYMALGNEIKKAFEFFNSYIESSDDDIEKDWDNGGFYSTYCIYVDSEEEIKKIELGSNETIISTLPNNHYDPIDGTCFVNFEVEIQKDYSLSEYKEAYWIQKKKEIININNKIIHLLYNLWQDVDIANKEEIYNRTLSFVIVADKHLRKSDFKCTDLILESLKSIGDFAIKTFIFKSLPKSKEYLQYFRNVQKTNNITHFKINNHYIKAKTAKFRSELISNGYISDDTTDKQILQFLRGEYPKPKINWIEGERYLYYFIKQLTSPDSDYLVEKNGQPFRFCTNIFLVNGTDPKPNWNRNCNKTKDSGITEILQILK